MADYFVVIDMIEMVFNWKFQITNLKL